jgi:hypothetical protein
MFFEGLVSVSLTYTWEKLENQKISRYLEGAQLRNLGTQDVEKLTDII